MWLQRLVVFPAETIPGSTWASLVRARLAKGSCGSSVVEILVLGDNPMTIPMGTGIGIPTWKPYVHH